MNRTQHRSPPRPLRRFLLATLLALPLAGACNGSSDAPATPITFSIDVTALDGKAPTDPLELRCDHENGRALGTLAVSFAITFFGVSQASKAPRCMTAMRCASPVTTSMWCSTISTVLPSSR